MDITEIAAVAAAIISAISLFKSMRDKRFERLESLIKETRDELKEEIKSARCELKQDIHFETERVSEHVLIFRAECLKEFENLRYEISDIKERLSFLEALSFYEDFPENPRREGARKMWQRRRTKKIEHRDQD